MHGPVDQPPARAESSDPALQQPCPLLSPLLTALSCLVSLQEKKGQAAKKGPEIEIEKLEKLLNLVRGPENIEKKKSGE